MLDLSTSPMYMYKFGLDMGRKSPRIRTGRGTTRRSTVIGTIHKGREARKHSHKEVRHKDREAMMLGKLRTVVGVGKTAITTRDRVIEVEVEESTDKILTGERGVWWGCWRVQRAGV